MLRVIEVFAHFEWKIITNRFCFERQWVKLSILLDVCRNFPSISKEDHAEDDLNHLG